MRSLLRESSGRHYSSSLDHLDTTGARTSGALVLSMATRKSDALHGVDTSDSGQPPFPSSLDSVQR